MVLYHTPSSTWGLQYIIFSLKIFAVYNMVSYLLIIIDKHNWDRQTFLLDECLVVVRLVASSRPMWFCQAVKTPRTAAMTHQWHSLLHQAWTRTHTCCMHHCIICSANHFQAFVTNILHLQWTLQLLCHLGHSKNTLIDRLINWSLIFISPSHGNQKIQINQKQQYNAKKQSKRLNEPNLVQYPAKEKQPQITSRCTEDRERVQHVHDAATLTALWQVTFGHLFHCGWAPISWSQQARW